MAFGAKRALIEGMYRIPEDISLTGIDGTSLALYSVPSITTMANDPLVLADYTVKMLLELMKGKSKDDPSVKIAISAIEENPLESLSTPHYKIVNSIFVNLVNLHNNLVVSFLS